MGQDTSSFTPLAIVGLSCRLPGANTLAEYWELIRSGGDATGELPPDLIDRELYYDPRKGIRGKSYTTVGGLVDQLPFDNSKCRLSEDWVRNTDPVHRVVCELASDALRSAHLDPFDLPTREVGVYLGHTGGTNKPGDIVYADYIEQAMHYLHDLETLGHLSRERRQEIADRIVREVRAECDHRDENSDLIFESSAGAQIAALAFGLQGPCLVIDAACASSMQALAMAGRALQQGTIDMALVGGASNCKRESLILFSAAQSVSADKSRPFDGDADGLITSEGYVLLVVKTLAQALADGDPIRCVVRGIGMSADGKGKSLWAPLKDGQKLAMERAYHGSPFGCGEVQYIEAHATSTQVGDATEISALAEAFPPRAAGQQPIPLGSVKANIGHTLETAGLAGLLKTVLAMEHGTIPPCANLEHPNPNIDWQSIPFCLPQRPAPWHPPADGETRKAAVNAFGIGGLNVHVVLEEFLPSKPREYYLPPAEVDPAPVHEPIAIIGIGNILPGAHSPEEYWNLLQTGQDPKVDAPIERWDASHFCQPGAPQPYRTYASRGGFVTGYQYDWRKHKVPPKQVAHANPLQFALLDAADRALQAAGYGPDKLDRDSVGVVVGTTFGGDFAAQLQIGLRLPDIDRRLRIELAKLGITGAQSDQVIAQYEQRVLQAMPALIDETGSFTSSTLASRITKTFDLRGGALALDGGVGTGLATLSVCCDTLRSGDCKMMLCAVGERSMDLAVFAGLSRQGVLARGIHPDFDETTDGFVPGEGCGVLVLKRLSDAERDGDQVIAVVRGIGAGAAWDDSGDSLRQAIERSLQHSRMQPHDVRALDVAGAQPKLEQTTLEQLHAVFGKDRAGTPLHVSSLVSQFGFMGANHAMAAIIKASLATQKGQLPRCVPPQRPRAGLFSAEIQPVQRNETIDHSGATGIGVLCGAASGTAYHAVIDMPGKPAAPKPATAAAVPAGAAIVRLGASTWDALRQRIMNDHDAALYQPGSAFGAQDRARLAIVCSSRHELDEKLRRVLSRWDTLQPADRNDWLAEGVFYGAPRPDGPTTAFLFPGHGSQYPGMFAALLQSSPAAQAAAAQIAAALETLGMQPLAELIGPAASGLGKVLWNTQASILCANWIADRTLRSYGIRPGVVAGHSFGEYAALASAGAWGITDGLRAARHRAEAINSLTDVEGLMVATKAPPAVVGEVLAAVGDGVWVANQNSADQVVISGATTAVRTAVDALQQRNVPAVILNVPRPFHSPLLAGAAEDLGRRLAQIPLVDTAVPVISTIGQGVMHRASQFLQSLGAQLTTKVDFPAMLNEVARFRPALIVEVGPKQVLTRLAQTHFQATDVVCMATDNRLRPAELALLDVVAQAECLGCNEPTTTMAEPTRPARGAQFIVYDATQRRRHKMKAKSQQAGQARAADAAPRPVNGTGHGETTHGHGAANGAHRAGGNGLPLDAPSTPAGQTKSRVNAATTASAAVPAAAGHTAQTRKPHDASAPLPQAPAMAAAPAPAPTATTSPGISGDEIKRVLVNFVVEQTGYPEEIIELDADLEGDLGIDSIKKAQLFGEVGMHYDIAPRDDLSLDDFSTLGHVLDFLAAELGASTAAPAPQTPAPRTVEPVVQAAVPAVESAPAPPTLSARAPVVATEATSDVDREALVAVLVNFVVEQTGYPEEIIELDADLEGDLGIDSIKKAQLFGEVGMHYDIAPRDDLSLDDFPTLGHVLDFLAAELGASTTTAPATQTPAPRTAEPVVQAVAPAVESAPAPPTLSARAPVVATEATSDVDREALIGVLVNFVVEQTGYPEDIIELDADLEGDLGIDSIKKAQLFGEVGVHYDIAPRDDLSLDDFPTLGHVLDFLIAELGGMSATAVSAAPPAPVVTDTSTPTTPLPVRPEVAETPALEQPPVSAVPRTDQSGVYPGLPGGDMFRVAVLQGLAGQRGAQYGQALQNDIRAALATLADTCAAPATVGVASWPCGLNEALSAASAAAGVNQEAVAAANAILEPLDGWPLGFLAQSKPTGFAVPTPLVAHVHQELEAHVYLAVAEACRLHVRVGINSARLAVSCEPTSLPASEADIVALTGKLHQVLAQANSTAAALQQLGELQLTGDWCVGVSDPCQQEPQYLVSGGGQIVVTDAAAHASSQQQAFHGQLAAAPDRLRFYDRAGSLAWELKLTDYLPAAPVPQTRTADAARVEDHRQQSSPQVMKRHVLRMTPAPSSVHAADCTGLTFAVIGAGEVGQAIAGLVNSRGGQATVFATAEEFVAHLDAHVTDHLVLAPFAEDASHRVGDASLADLYLDTFTACQQWVGRHEERGTRALLSAVTRLGGDFGFASDVPNYAGGGLPGFLKGIRRDAPSLRLKALDFDAATAAPEIAEILLRELTSSCSELEIGYRDGQRYVVQAVQAPADLPRQPTIPSGGVWVVTGGGRGVTAVVARELGQQFGLKLHLLGTAPPAAADAPWRGLDEAQLRDFRRQSALEARAQGISPPDHWRKIEKSMELDANLRSFAEAGVDATYHQCDVSDREQVAQTLATIRHSHGPLQGVLHGAGIEAACRLSRKQRETVRATIASKCDGAAHLIALTSDDPLQYFVSFGSTSGRFGGLGQADYSLASDLLAKMMGRLATDRPPVKAVCFHWPAWDEVGMAARPESRYALEHYGIEFMPPREGVEHLVAELAATAGETEVLIINEDRRLDTDSTMVRTSPPVEPTLFQTPAQRQPSQAEPTIKREPSPSAGPAIPAATSPPASRPTNNSQPLIDAVAPGTAPGTHEATFVLYPDRDPFLVHHRFRGRPFLPGVISLEAFAEAAQLIAPQENFIGFSNVRLERGLALPDDQPVETKIRLQSVADGIQCELVAPFINAQGKTIEPERVYSSATVRFGQTPQIEPIDPGEPLFGWSPFYYPQDVAIVHGMPMQSFKQLDYKHGGGRAQVGASSCEEVIGDRLPHEMLVASLALDGSLVACGFWSYCMLETQAGLPYGIKEYRQVRQTKDFEQCTLRFFHRETNAIGEVYDFILLGQAGDVICEVQGYQTAAFAEAK